MPEVVERNVKVFEVDVPAQLERKREVCDAAGIALPDTIAYVPFDFASTLLTEGLVAQGFRKGAGAMFVWEGVIGYITSEMIDASLAFMAHSGGAGTRVVFTFSDIVFDPVPAQERTKRAGFTWFEDHDFGAIWPRYLPGEPPAVASYSKIGVAGV